MTVEEKAAQYASSIDNFSDEVYDAFIAGYTMRDGESQSLLEACQKVIELRSLIEYGDVTESNQDEALVLFRLVCMCEKAVESFISTS